MLLLNFYTFTFLLNFTFTFAAFIPNGRIYHSSVLIGDKLYFSGGYNNSIDSMSEFFYLDVSKPFTTTDNVSIPWIDLTYTSGPSKIEATACTGGKNNDMIFIFGGSSPPTVIQSFVNPFDTNKQQWIKITSVGNIPSYRSYISCANFDNGLIAIFSGSNPSNTITNDLWIFNTLTLTWSLSNATNAPLPIYVYCAITLSDGNILYIGGYSKNITDYVPMNNSISGPTPSARGYFSAVLIMLFSIKFLNKCLSIKVF
ncbi:hypothetical protein C2G38_2143914 [Gigaspora rosea]|uniref:Galactose oxidase n=1 Tax=Gigaspora rosea TaxID=44941 RepID=A0A397V602_9GLOM|nr:hypothetical protein C2G38_2143914 [Gigaspora rosea]